MKCPKCIGKLEPVRVEMSEVFMPEKGGKNSVKTRTTKLELDQCFVCKGVWFDKDELEKYLLRGFTAIDSPPVSSDIRETLDRKSALCPRCGAEMLKKRAPRDSSIIIDQCSRCAGIWLDNTEIDKLEQGKLSPIEKLKLKLKNLF
ncbi:MAG TPA: zf-TFIIB domain-containing protein [bacterium]|nr:zf-TFIIB domain-containing protein [bacterium]